MKRLRGRPRIGRNYKTSLSIRMSEKNLQTLKLRYDQFITANGNWDERGNRHSFNEFILKGLKL